MAKSTFTTDDDALLEELGVEVEAKKLVKRTPREERIIAGFEEIQRFVEQQGRLPAHGESNDIFERLYATRLDQIRKLKECRTILEGLDHQDLLDTTSEDTETPIDEIDDDELLSQLGVSAPSDSDVTKLKHVKPRAEVRAAEEIANRTPCEDFTIFKPIFETVQKELDNGVRETRRFAKDAGIVQGEFFILNGQVVYVASVGEEERRTKTERPDSRLRVIYDNGTESDILMRSLQRALYKDEAGRRITDPSAGPLFGNEQTEQDSESGTIYVLRSNSDHPQITENRELIHKIGVTGGEVEARVAGAESQATFLFADVEIAATYKLFNVNRAKLENLLHRFFAPVRLELQIKDRFGRPVKPREWFLVPINVIDEVVEKIMDLTITQYEYDPSTASIKKIADG